jgi:hypothetical protein
MKLLRILWNSCSGGTHFFVKDAMGVWRCSQCGTTR